MPNSLNEKREKRTEKEEMETRLVDIVSERDGKTENFYRGTEENLRVFFVSFSRRRRERSATRVTC